MPGISIAMTKIYSPKKLIEVALPLDDINVAAAREKSIRHGHPSTLHLWWARRPLAAARAVIFAQMVNDPGYQDGDGFKYGVNKKEAEHKREKLFQIIRDLVKWENTNNEEVLNRAREAIKESWRETCQLNRNHPQAAELFNPDKLPAFHDPFAGGGAIPLEAQRLGLESYASDLNPVAVIINKAMIEFPPKFADKPPIGPIPELEKQIDMLSNWSGACGIGEDVRRYGHWVKEEAIKRIGHLYPKIVITEEMVTSRKDLAPILGEACTFIACIWARTVKSPNPAFAATRIPLVRSFVLSSKKGKEAWVEPIVEGHEYKFVVHTGKLPQNTLERTVQRTGAVCLLSGAAIPFSYIRSSGKQGGIGQKLMAIVAESSMGRVYLSPIAEVEDIALSAKTEDIPTSSLPEKALSFRVQEYGMLKHVDLFTARQLVALSTLSDIVIEAREKIFSDALSSNSFLDDDRSLNAGGLGAYAYADAVTIYLGLAVSRSANTLNALAVWSQSREQSVNLFSRQALPMAWDFPEVNPFAGAAGDFALTTNSIKKAIVNAPAKGFGEILLHDAKTQKISINKVVSTDPPYYDNIGYADLSDFFYIWLRRSLSSILPNLFSTITVPKADELIATPFRHKSKHAAEKFFLDGMTEAMGNIVKQSHDAFPITIYYAFKQSETKAEGTSNTGWETFLEAVISAGMIIDGTWPIRTERPTGVKASINALASSIILVCRKSFSKEVSISRREFQRELRERMPDALEAMIGGEFGQTPIAPVDLAQAAIGPGIAIFSKYETVLNQDGTKMTVHDALILINRAITEYLNPDSGNFDADTLFCDDWFSQYGWSAGQFGEADTLARAKGTSVDGLRESGVVESGGAKVRLLKWGEYPSDWDPKTDTRTPIWEACHQLIRALNQQGEGAAGELLAKMPERGEPIRQLAYHLYTLCERNKWAEEARVYNELIGSWHAIVSASFEVGEKHYGETLDMGF